MNRITFFFVCVLSTSLFSCSIKREIADASKHMKVTLPSLVDSIKFWSDLKNTNEIEKLYHVLKGKGWPYTYKYYFSVNKDGKIKEDGRYLDKEISVRSLNRFFTSKFNKYRWIPGHEHDCQTCKIVCYGIINVHFKVPRNEVEMEILMFDGKIKENARVETIYRAAMSF